MDGSNYSVKALSQASGGVLQVLDLGCQDLQPLTTAIITALWPKVWESLGISGMTTLLQ